MKITTLDIELAVVARFGVRQNVIVPNISWGLGIHECDLLIVTNAGYAIEVEIKISKADLKKDALKGHGHVDKRIKALYFAIPENLISCTELIPDRAGIFIVRDYASNGPYFCECVRKPTINKTAHKLTPTEYFKVAHLGAMRIWGLKRTIRDRAREVSNI